MIELTKSSIRCWQKYSYNGKIEVGPNSTQVLNFLTCQLLLKRADVTGPSPNCTSFVGLLMPCQGPV